MAATFTAFTQRHRSVRGMVAGQLDDGGSTARTGPVVPSLGRGARPAVQARDGCGTTWSPIPQYVLRSSSFIPEPGLARHRMATETATESDGALGVTGESTGLSRSLDAFAYGVIHEGAGPVKPWFGPG